MINANLKFFLSFLIIHFSFPYFSYFPFPFPFIFSFFLFPLASLSPVLSRSPLFSLVLFLNLLLSLHSLQREAARAVWTIASVARGEGCVSDSSARGSGRR
jgi:hypothetical protein